MRVRGDNAPSNAFTLEEQPKRPGFVLARFYENAEPFEETTDGLTMRGFAYDEYRLELEHTDSLVDDILSNYDAYMNEAKLREAEGDIIPSLKERVAQLEEEKAALTVQVADLDNQVTEAQLALCDVYELMLGG